MKKQISTFGGIPVMALGALLLVSQIAQAQTVVTQTATNLGCVFTLTLPGTQFGASRDCDGACPILSSGGVLFGPMANPTFFQPQIAATAGCGPLFQLTVDYPDQGFGPLRPPPDGACILPSCRIVVSAVTAEAASGPKVAVIWTNQICVVQHFQVKFDHPVDENFDDNFDDNGEDDCDSPHPKKTYANWNKLITKFKSCQKIEIQADMFDCSHVQLRGPAMSAYSAFLSVAEYHTTNSVNPYTTGSVLVTNVVGLVTDDDSGILMKLVGDDFKYKLNTRGFPCATLWSKNFFRVVVKVIPNDGSGIVVGQEDFILASKRCEAGTHCSDDD